MVLRNHSGKQQGNEKPLQAAFMQGLIRPGSQVDPASLAPRGDKLGWSYLHKFNRPRPCTRLHGQVQARR